MARRSLPELPTISYAGDRSPCERHDCRLCCYDTQMPLLPSDIERLVEHTGRAVDDFSHIDPEDGQRQLSNTEGHCVFLGDHGCTVYEARPVGCRLYPLVHDADTGKAILDDLCPHTREFRIRPKDRVALREIVDELLDGRNVA